jgi:hypothetical protein
VTGIDERGRKKGEDARANGRRGFLLKAGGALAGPMAVGSLVRAAAAPSGPSHRAPAVRIALRPCRRTARASS